VLAAYLLHGTCAIITTSTDVAPLLRIHGGVSWAAKSAGKSMQLRPCGINPDTLRRMLVSHDIQQRLLLLRLHTPILRGGSEENLLF
jgi:hypothetical protein